MYIFSLIVCNKIFIIILVFEVNIMWVNWGDVDVYYEFVVNIVYKVRN